MRSKGKEQRAQGCVRETFGRRAKNDTQIIRRVNKISAGSIYRDYVSVYS